MNAHPTAGTAASNLQAGARLALVGLAVNVAFAFIKIAAGVFGNAYALIADGIESALDAAGSIVIWGGLRFAARPPDATHPYGHGKAEPLAAVVVALGVLVAAAALAVASVREIFLPHHGPAPFTLFVLIIAVIVKGSLFRSVSRLGRAIDSTAITTDAWHHRADAIISMAAAVGISIALVGGENGNARMITRPCSPVPLSLPQGRGYSARRCAKFSIPRRVVKLVRIFEALHVPSPA